MESKKEIKPEPNYFKALYDIVGMTTQNEFDCMSLYYENTGKK